MFGESNTEDIIKEYRELGKTNEWRMKLIFLTLFLYTNKLQTACDKMDDKVSIRQWMVIIMTLQYKKPPTLSQLAGVLGCSRQNVKKLALILEKNGYITLERDENDGRALVVKLTSKSAQYFEDREQVTNELLYMMFGRLTEGKIQELFILLSKLFEGIEDVEEAITSKKLSI